MSDLKKFKTDDSAEIHGNIAPFDIRNSQVINARVRGTTNGLKFDQQLKVWRISPLGVELVCDPTVDIRKGSEIELELKIGETKSLLTGLAVDNIVEKNGSTYLHIRLIARNKERIESIERRSANRWICSEEYYPTAVASNPAIFNEFLYFKVRDISYGGFKLQTSLRNKFVVPGMVFECIMNFPMISNIKVKFEIKTVRVEMIYGKEVLTIGAAYDVKNRELVEVLGQYLMQFGDVSSLDQIRSAGFKVKSISNAISFSYVRTKEEYEEVLKLRFSSYSLAGKIKEGTTYLDMADSYDARSRIIIGKFRGEVVASARLTFSQYNEVMEQEKYVQWPAELPRRDEMVEAMRACTRYDFRRSDLLISLFKFICLSVAQSERRWIVLCATDEMKPLYKKIGFSEVGLKYEHVKLNNLVHNIMLANVPDAMEGSNVGPIMWNVVWSDVSGYLEKYGIIEPNPLSVIRLTVYRALGPICRGIYNTAKWCRELKTKKFNSAVTKKAA